MGKHVTVEYNGLASAIGDMKGGELEPKVQPQPNHKLVGHLIAVIFGS